MDTLPTPGLTRPASPRQLEWLAAEVARWRADGLVDDGQAAAILAGYRPSRRFSLAALALWLGSAFVGIGLVWLVAANLDRFAPGVRFGIVTVLWLGFVGLAELLDRRITTRRSPVVGAARGVAALAYGAVVMQAAQSLQVPAYDASLVGFWAAGAVLYAYAVRGVAPLVVGVALASTWLVWHTGDTLGGPLPVVLALGAIGAVGFAAALLHDRPVLAGADRFDSVWRLLGAGAALVALFISALPWDSSDRDLDAWLVGALVLAGALTAVALVRGGSWRARIEPVLGAAALGLAALLALWAPEDHEFWEQSGQVSGEQWLAAIVSVVVFVAVAAGVAAVGVLREEPHLTWLAVVGLAVFTTVQSFAVFAQVIDGAWLFVVLGIVFAGTGWVADRARREMVEALEGADR